MEHLSIEFIEAIAHKCSKKKVFSKYWRKLQETNDVLESMMFLV